MQILQELFLNLLHVLSLDCHSYDLIMLQFKDRVIKFMCVTDILQSIICIYFKVNTSITSGTIVQNEVKFLIPKLDWGFLIIAVLC